MPGIIPKVDSETFRFADEVVEALAEDLNNLIDGGSGTTVVSLANKAAWTALATKDPNTLYVWPV